MSKILTFSLPILSVDTSSGQQLVFPLSLPEMIDINASPAELAHRFGNAIQRQLINKGDYKKATRFFINNDSRIDQIFVDVTPQPKGDPFLPHSIQFDFLSWRQGDHWIGLVPVMGVVSISSDSASLQQNLRESIALTFVKDKTLLSLRNLIALQWYKDCSVVTENIEIEFHTPKELSQLETQSHDKILPKACQKMRYTPTRAVGMEAHILDMTEQLQGEFKQSVLLVGPSGCGKTALVNEYFHGLSKLESAKIWETSAARLLQKLTEDSGWQFNLGLLVQEISDQQAILSIGPLHELFEVGQYSGNNISLAEALKEHLQRHEVLIIAEATPEQIEAIDLRSPGYSQLFHTLRIAETEPSKQDQIIKTAVIQRGQHHQIEIEPGAIKRIIDLQRRYSPYSGFPGKTIRFFESLMLQLQNQKEILTEQHAIAAYCQESGLPGFLVDTSTPFSPAQANQFFDQYVIGQSQSKQCIIRAITAVKVGLQQLGKPIASFLFVGPTGTGKTQVAKTLASYIFGHSNRLIRFDMSEYSDYYAISRLISTGEASLVTRVRQNPFAVILFDEIEKTDSSFYDLLLQILGEGRLTDDQGDVANFCSTIIVMTSNIGASDFMRPNPGFNSSDQSAPSHTIHFENAIETHFRPELVNRIDQVVPFSTLNDDQRRAIISLQINLWKNNHALLGQGYTLAFTDEVLDYLVNQPIEEKYGARAIQRLLNEHMLMPLRSILVQQSPSAKRSIQCQVSEHKLTFSVDNDQSGKSHKNKRQPFDTLAILRRELQQLQDSLSWHALLSELDRLQIRLRAKGQSFWAKPQQSTRYQQLTSLTQAQTQVYAQAIAYEEKALIAQLNMDQNSDPSMDFNTRDTLTRKVNQQCLRVRYLSNPSGNQCLFIVYGIQPWLEQWIEFYEMLFSQYAQAHFFTDTDHFIPKKFFVYQALDEKCTQSSDFLSRLPTTNKALKPQTDMAFQKRLSNGVEPVGIGFIVNGSCVYDLLSLDQGVVAIEDDKNKKHLSFIDVSNLPLSDYQLPYNVHRKQFYKNRKATRLLNKNNIQLDESASSQPSHCSSEDYAAKRLDEFVLNIKKSLLGLDDD